MPLAEFRGVCRSRKVPGPILLNRAGIQCILYCKGHWAAKVLCVLRLLGPRHEVGKRAPRWAPKFSRRVIGNENSPDYLDTKYTALINRNKTYNSLHQNPNDPSGHRSQAKKELAERDC